MIPDIQQSVYEQNLRECPLSLSRVVQSQSAMLPFAQYLVTYSGQFQAMYDLHPGYIEASIRAAVNKGLYRPPEVAREAHIFKGGAYLLPSNISQNVFTSGNGDKSEVVH